MDNNVGLWLLHHLALDKDKYLNCWMDCYDIFLYGAQMSKPTDFGDPLTFHLPISSCQILNFFNTLVCDQILAKQMTSAILFCLVLIILF